MSRKTVYEQRFGKAFMAGWRAYEAGEPKSKSFRFSVQPLLKGRQKPTGRDVFLGGWNQAQEHYGQLIQDGGARM